MTNLTAEEGKTLSIIAYLTIIGAVIALLLNGNKKNPFTAFHVRQGLGLCITYMLLGYFISSFDSFLVSSAFWLGFAVLFILGIISAAKGKMTEVPLVGAFYQKVFSGVGN